MCNAPGKQFKKLRRAFAPSLANCYRMRHRRVLRSDDAIGDLLDRPASAYHARRSVRHSTEGCVRSGDTLVHAPTAIDSQRRTRDVRSSVGRQKEKRA